MFHLTLPIGNGIGSSHDIPLQAQREGRVIAPTHSQASTSKKWVVSTMPSPLYLPERSGTHCTGGWVGLWGRSGWGQKVLPPLGFSLQAVQSISSHYADRAIPVATRW